MATKEVRQLQKELRDHLKANPKLNRHPHREKDLLGPLTDKEKNDIIVSEIKSIIGKKGSKVHLNPKLINIDDLKFDDTHINNERGHTVTKQEAVQWIKEAKISISVWKGQYERYYSVNGAVYVDLVNKVIRTAFSSQEYDEITLRILEVLKKNGK